MSSLNKVCLIGHLGRDPEMRRMTNGDPAVTLSVATSESWTDKRSGEKREQTEWHRVLNSFNAKLILLERAKEDSAPSSTGTARARDIAAELNDEIPF